MINNLCIIPGRGGSKGIPNKNIKDFKGKPLVAWSIEHALDAKLIDKIIVSTDSDKIAHVAENCGVGVHWRSKESAGDNVHSVYTILECIDFYEKQSTLNNIIMLLPTSPLRQSKYINEMIKMFDKNNCDSIISVSEFEKPVSSLRYMDEDNILSPIIEIDNFNIQHQDIKNPLYEVNGSIYISTAEHLKKVKSFHKGKLKGYVMPVNESVDINTIENWRLAEAVLEHKRNNP